MLGRVQLKLKVNNMSKKITLGNTGISFDIPENEDDINPCQVGKHKVDYMAIDHENIRVEVYYPITGRGPCFNWEWADKINMSHTTEEAGIVEEYLFETYNKGVYERGIEEGGGLIIAAGKCLAYLTGTFMNGDIVKSTEIYFEGSFAYGYRAGELPVFTIDSQETLINHGKDILKDNCIIEFNNVRYLITHDKFTGHNIDATSRRADNESFYRELRRIADNKHISGAALKSPMKYATDFKGVNDEDIVVYECEDIYTWQRLSAAAIPPMRTFIYNGIGYIYRSVLEMSESAKEALREI